MPEIIPVTKDQLFEKKIAENTGSAYNVGDISDVVPVTKDQALLKEIALNSAGQSGDITELEVKVADNSSAIEAIEKENGAYNILPNNASTTTVSEITFTVNADKSVTATGNQPSTYRHIELCTGLLLKAGTYVLSKVAENTLPLYLYMSNDDQSGAEIATCLTTPVSFTLASDAHVSVLAVVQPNEGTVNATIYPMIYDVRFNPTGYVQYIMPNRELTERTTWHHIGYGADDGGEVSCSLNYSEFIFTMNAENINLLQTLIIPVDQTGHALYIMAYQSNTHNAQTRIDYDYSNSKFTFMREFLNGWNNIRIDVYAR